MRFQGTGRGNAVGAPLEAVVQDLCDTRQDLKRSVTAINEMKATNDEAKVVLDSMLVALQEMKSLLVDLRDNTSTAVEEARKMRTAMADVKLSVENAKTTIEANNFLRRPTNPT